MRDRDCIEFLRLALPGLGRSWAGYRKVRQLVCKRLRRRLKTLRLTDLNAYGCYLADCPAERRELDGLCAIPISRFYRDHGVFNTLSDDILPELARAASARRVIEAWSAGCASGEEPYTLSLIWAVRLEPRFPAIKMRIVATDGDAGMVARGWAGEYAASSLKDLPADLRAAGFEKRGGMWRIRDQFRYVDFLQQDLREGMPAGPFDLVLCRNAVCTYYAPAVQVDLMTRIADRIRPGGVLVIGAHESLPPAVRGLAIRPDGRMVYRKEARARAAACG